MRLSLLAALAAATALIPAAAIAQHHDRGGWQQGDRGSRGDRGGHTAAPSRPDSGRGDFRSRAPLQTPQRQYARPERPAQVRRGDVRQGFDRPNAGRPTQVRPDGNWHAQAGGSHADRSDRNDWNRDRPAQWRQNGDRDHNREINRDPGRQWSGNRDRGHQWTGDRNDRDHRWNGDRDRGQRWDGNRNDRDRWNGNGNRGHQWGRDRNDHGRFDRNWRHDNRYDWHNYRTRHRTAYRLPRYYAPYGWDYGYRRFGIGFRLNSVLFGSSYWISDPYYYRLPPAYGPYRWVRYYNDALLVDIDTGTVVDVVYDIFW